ncbi:dicarboxylate/amino acid:cation symporter [Sphingorhabdus sp.]|uniref:dicarboxylate/amino acid:cation symporter n=1 Tax=Sphingorhabdus sp. TaxID=1902408 RepID=UPI0035B2FC2F
MNKTFFILAMLVAGILAGELIGDAAPILNDAASVIGTVWLNALRMTVVPLVVALLIVGIVQTAAAARAGKIAFTGVVMMITLLWTSSAIAAFMIPTLTSAFPIPREAAQALISGLTTMAPIEQAEPFTEIIKKIVPTNPIGSAANTDVLPLIVFTLAFAFAVVKLPEDKRRSIHSLFDAVADAMVMIVGWVLALAPIGVFALAYGLGVTAGSAAFGALAHYVIVLVATGSVIWLLSFVIAFAGAGKNPFVFFRAAIPAQAVAISTQSSLASLPAMLQGLNQLGVRTRNSEIILPIAVALFRATGPAMNFGVALYIAHLMGIELTAGQIALGLAAGAITTMGAVSLPGSISFISSIAPICIAMGVPVEPLGLLIAIETFPDIMRTLGNVTMDMAVTATVDKHVGEDDPAHEGEQA